MKTDPHRYIRTLDVVADAVQFTDAQSATAIVWWINDLVRSGPEASASYDSARNIVALPPSTCPKQLEIGWWVVRWPNGEFAAHTPDSFASVFDPPRYLGHPASAHVEQRTYHDRGAPRFA
jgi:hypothetical protein